MYTKKNWKVAILFICVFATKISAQTPFTKKQVYNFNPGDVMQTTNKYTQTPGPPIYETDSIAEDGRPSWGIRFFTKSSIPILEHLLVRVAMQKLL